MTGVQVLVATAVCGVLQAVFGGQPLLIVGVAEPIVLLYKVCDSCAGTLQSTAHAVVSPTHLRPPIARVCPTHTGLK